VLDHDSKNLGMMMISTFSYTLLLPFMLVAMIGAIFEMDDALGEADVERFLVWIGVAAIVAGLPLVL
jgi:hypothetical protein